jgi:hypothetical protein
MEESLTVTRVTAMVGAHVGRRTGWQKAGERERKGGPSAELPTSGPPSGRRSAIYP